MADERAHKTPEEVIAFFNRARDEALEKMRRNGFSDTGVEGRLSLGHTPTAPRFTP